MAPEQVRVNKCGTLDELCSLLNQLEDFCREETELWMSDAELDEYVDIYNLPTFSSHKPALTDWIWSWDDKRVLIAVGGVWSLRDRCLACGEAKMNCQCNR